ncbi:MAG: hypothetical protein HYX37_14180 [Rhizobiales bacterium]|nr:hypothetical protein [Hyphomicrobiales bacterium]
MRLSALAATCVAVSLLFAGAAGAAPNSEPVRLTGPVSHDNLAIYFVHGVSKTGPVPLTLAEAMAQRVVQVRETGNVNSLEIENLGDQDVFVQAGDIVKGGQQDRTLTVSLLLPPKSGRIPIASFCVEHGRWSARAGEDVRTFSTSAATVSSREMKLAMQAPLPASPTTGSGAMDTGDRQQKVWDGIRHEQQKLSAATGANVSAPASATSLQLALENKKLAEVRNVYVAALKPAGEQGDDIVGYVFAVNGKINSAEIYASNGLFRKMWPKMLDASATEAIGQKHERKDEVPAVDAVMAFLAGVDGGRASEKPLNFGVQRVTRETAKAVMFETAPAAAPWVHRSYLAK